MTLRMSRLVAIASLFPLATAVRHFGASLIVALALAAPGAAKATDYTFTFLLNSSFQDDFDVIATGINDAGQVIGRYFFTALPSMGFLYTNGSVITIKADPEFTDPTGINNAGQIVGNVGFGFGGFLYIGGSFTTIDVPGASETGAIAINDRGQIVGGFSNSTGNHGFLYTGGSFTTIDVPGASETEAFGINDRGQIVGDFSDSTGNHGFVYTGGKFTTIDAPGGAGHTEVNSINNAGQIVGSASLVIRGAPTIVSFLADPVGQFAGTPGQANCISNSVSALVQKYGGEAAAASVLGDSSILELQNAVATYCGG